MLRLNLKQWLQPHLGIKRWMLLAGFGLGATSLGIALALLALFSVETLYLPEIARNAFLLFLLIIFGSLLTALSLRIMIRNLLAPYRHRQKGNVVDMMLQHQQRGKGFKFVAIGGGTGLPASLRGMKAHTSN